MKRYKVVQHYWGSNIRWLRVWRVLVHTKLPNTSVGYPEHKNYRRIPFTPWLIRFVWEASNA